MKPVDLQAEISKMEDHIRSQHDECGTLLFYVGMIRGYVQNYDKCLNFYGDRNFDDGLMARYYSGRMTDADKVNISFHQHNAMDLRPRPPEETC